MDDVAVPAAQQANPPLPGSEQVNSLPDVKETPKAEKWPFPEPQPIREDQVKNAVNFLSHPKVRGTPMVQRFSFLERKGLTREEIDEAFRRCPDPSTSEVTKAIVTSEGKLPTPLPTQAYSPSTHQAIVSPPQPTQHYINGPPSAIVPARSGLHWSQLILGAGLIAAAGAGTGYFFQSVLAPKFKAWFRDMVLDEKRASEKCLKPSYLEEAVGAAAAAASAAAAAAAEVANTSREVLKLQAEERQQLRNLIKSLDTKAEDLKSILADLSKNAQGAQGQMVSVHAEEPIGANYYKGSMRAYQRTPTPVEQVQMKQEIQMFESMAMGNGVDKSHSNGYTATTNNSVAHSEEEPWWQHKKVEVEAIMSPKQSTVSELEAGLDQERGSAGFRNNEISTHSRGVPLGRQGWTPPPVPKTVMPGAASAIRYQKLAIINEGKPSIVSEEKEVDSQTFFEQQPQPLLQTEMAGSPSGIRLQNPVIVEETRLLGVAEEKEMDAQASFDQYKGSVGAAEVAEITSEDKEIPLSMMHDDIGVAPSEVPEIASSFEDA